MKTCKTMETLAILTLLLLASSLLLACGDNSTPTPQPPPTSNTPDSNSPPLSSKPLIALIPALTDSPASQALHAGALKAQLESVRPPTNEPKFDLYWPAALAPHHPAEQIKIAQDMIQRRVAGIILAPSDARTAAIILNLVPPNIPVILIDSPALDSTNYKSRINTDHLQAGRLAGQHLVSLVGPQGKILMLRETPATPITAQREQGCIDAIKEVGLDIIITGHSINSPKEAPTAVTILDTFKSSGGTLQIDAIFSSNEPATLAMLQALQSAKLAGKIKLVALDASEKLTAALAAGELHALVVQDRLDLGYKAVQTMHLAMREKSVDQQIDLPATLITAENLTQPAIKELLHPDLKKWLK